MMDVLEFAITAHGNQMRRGGEEPYVNHPVRVASQCQANGYPQCLKVALLHDVVEDTDLTMDDCAVYLNEEELEALDLLTKRVGESSEQALTRLLQSDNEIALVVKYWDAWDNSQLSEAFSKTITNPRHFAGRYVEKMELIEERCKALGIVLQR